MRALFLLLLDCDLTSFLMMLMTLFSLIQMTSIEGRELCSNSHGLTLVKWRFPMGFLVLLQTLSATMALSRTLTVPGETDILIQCLDMVFTFTVA